MNKIISEEALETVKKALADARVDYGDESGSESDASLRRTLDWMLAQVKDIPNPHPDRIHHEGKEYLLMERGVARNSSDMIRLPSGDIHPAEALTHESLGWITGCLECGADLYRHAPLRVETTGRISVGSEQFFTVECPFPAGIVLGKEYEIVITEKET